MTWLRGSSWCAVLSMLAFVPIFAHAAGEGAGGDNTQRAPVVAPGFPNEMLELAEANAALFQRLRQGEDPLRPELFRSPIALAEWTEKHANLLAGRDNQSFLLLLGRMSTSAGPPPAPGGGSTRGDASGDNRPSPPGAVAAPRAQPPSAGERYYAQIGDRFPYAYSEAGRLAGEREAYSESLQYYGGAIQGGYRNPETFTGYARAAHSLGDYGLARDAAALALKMEPGHRGATAVLKLSQGRVSSTSLPSVLGPGGSERAAAQWNAQNAEFAAGVDAAPAAFVAGGAPQGAVTPPAGPQGGGAPPDAGAALSPIQASAQATENARHALTLKDYPLAVVHATKAIEYNAENAQALNYRAIAYNRMQRYSDAVTDASTALELAPGNAAALQTRSWAFAQQKEFRKALNDAEDTLRTDPRNAFAYQNKAFALAGLGDRAGALDSLRLSAALDARFKGQYERAMQLPQDQDLTLLFDDKNMAAAAAAAPRPAQTPKRFARMALLSATGGLLIALGILHVVSASWREKVRMTVRRVLAPADAVAGDPAMATPAPGVSAFWTQYDLVKEIGMGGMGVVYEATDRSLERRVAVKKMRDEIRIDPQERQRFVNEAKVVAQLRHPNIVDIYAIVEDGGDVYLVFEYVEGRTLHDRLRSEGVFSFGEGLKIFRDMVGAVEHAHAAKIVHRDLKPSNVMVTKDGRVKVMDFGVARQAKDALTKMSMTNSIVGTPPYMAPEQEQGTVRKESDVYALGVCFYEMLTGQLPFAGTGSGMLLNKINGKHIPPTQRVPSLPASLDAVMAKALHPDPDKRHHTAAELLADLERLA
ncbi:MAG: protein kinase [Elusimicrobiota bacterium]|nr:protein kinase [Elusimicrobiota bacterium]